MKKFDFRLQKVMEYKEHKEKEKQRELAKAKDRLRSELERLLGLNQRQAFYHDHVRKINLDKMNLRELSLYQTYLQKLSQEILHQKCQVRTSEENVSESRKKLLESSKEKKTLETLRAKKFQAYRKEMDRTEQKEIDESAKRPFQKS